MANRLRAAAVLVFALLCAANAVASAPLRVAVISDLNGSYGKTDYAPRVSDAVRRIVAMKPDLVISTGDMVAGQRRPHLTEAEVRAMWDGFHETVSDPLAAAGIPLVVTPGNHDASAYDGFARERRIYAEEWLARKPDLSFISDEDYPFFYGFELGGLRFVSLDATIVGGLDRMQIAALDQLVRPDRATVVFSHLPIWPFAQGRETEIIGDPTLIALFERNGVILHLSGHHHAFYPGARKGVAYVAQSCLGGGPRRLVGQTERSPPGFVMLEMAADGSGSVSFHTADNASARPSLPAVLQTPFGPLERLDVVAGARLRLVEHPGQ